MTGPEQHANTVQRLEEITGRAELLRQWGVAQTRSITVMPDGGESSEPQALAALAICVAADLDELVARADFADAYKYRHRAEAAEAERDRLARRVAELEEHLERERKARKAAEELNADEVLAKRTNLEAVIESERSRVAELEAALRDGTRELDDAIKAAVSEEWSQEDYDRWDVARRKMEALAGDGGGA